MSGRPRRARPVKDADPDSTRHPTQAEAAEAVAPGRSDRGPSGDELQAAILRYLRRWPNETVDLLPLANELGVPPEEVQLTAERLHRMRLLVAPFIVPGRAGGGTLTEEGLRWLIEREGGKPTEVPVAFQKADRPVRAADEAARLPRAQVYGVRRG